MSGSLMNHLLVGTRAVAGVRHSRDHGTSRRQEHHRPRPRGCEVVSARSTGRRRPQAPPSRRRGPSNPAVEHPELHDERREAPSPATIPRSFSEVRRTMRASAELALRSHRSGPKGGLDLESPCGRPAPAQERAEPSFGAGLVGCGGGSVRWCAAWCVLGDTPFCTTSDKKHPARPPPHVPSRK